MEKKEGEKKHGKLFGFFLSKKHVGNNLATAEISAFQM